MTASLLLAFAMAVPAAPKNGKLIDVRSFETGNGAARSQFSFCLAVTVDDLSYLSRYEPYGRWSYKPTDLIVGDEIQVKIEKDNLFLAKPKGGFVKTHILRRQRVSADLPPMTCSDPVAVRN